MMRTVAIWMNRTDTMEKKEILGAIESLAYVSGEPVGFAELQRVFDLTEAEVKRILNDMLEDMTAQGRGVIPFITEKTVQLVTNPSYNEHIIKLLAPPEERNMSDSMIETLSVIAYRQPVTRADIEAVRGVRCEYSVSQLLRQGLICELGRKDCVGRPMLFGTTDTFLRKFGLHSLDELPPMPSTEDVEGEINVV